MSLKIKSNSHFDTISVIQEALLKWYSNNGRHNLPWKVNDIYKIWISEIMLQQTQVKSVIPYYQKFIQKYPTISDLIKAKKNDILKLWSGLGFYRRAENIFKTCEILKKKHNGKLPVNYDDLILLPGIGKTTASAILTFSGNGAYSILDANVKRFLSRLLRIENTTKNNKYLWDYSTLLLPNDKASEFIQAYMDIGSMICTPKKPNCGICPVVKYCISHTKGFLNTNEINKPKIKENNIWVMVLVNSKNQFFLESVNYNGLWRGLYSSPLFKNYGELSDWIKIHNIELNKEHTIWKFVHHLSHIKFSFNVIFYKVKSNKKISLSPDNWYNLSNIEFGMPKYQNKIIDKYKSINDYN